jgi:hypothetical protein
MTTDSQMLADRAAVADVLLRFAASFDEKNWDGMRECLDDAVDCDYSSLRGVGQRIAALATLVMQHDLTNLRVRIDGDTAAVQCNFVIRRFSSSAGGHDFFHSYGRYLFSLIRREMGSRISGITQVVTRNHGNPAIHGGAATGTEAGLRRRAPRE